MERFKFENTIRLTESEYLNIWALVSAHTAARIIRLIAFTVIGILFLFDAYTLLLGIGILLMIGIRVIHPRLISVGAHSNFRQQRYLQETLTYGINNQKLWVKGTKISASASLQLLIVWREREELLILSAVGIPPVYLSVSQMKEQGVYEKVKDLAMRYGKEFKEAGLLARAI